MVRSSTISIILALLVTIQPVSYTQTFSRLTRLATLQEKIKLYKEHATDENLIAMHKAQLDLRDLTSPAPLSTFLQKIDRDLLTNTQLPFLKMVEKNPILFNEVRKYRTWTIQSSKELRNKLKKHIKSKRKSDK